MYTQPDDESYMATPRNTLAGALAAIFSSTFWGASPVYWKLLDHVDALEIHCHRIVWTLLCLIPVLRVQGSIRETFRAVRGLKPALTLVGSSLCIGTCWIVFVLAVNDEQVLAVSLGFFIAPLSSAALGVIFFRDKLSPIRAIAIVLVIVGVGNAIIAHGSLPWISVTIALAFGFFHMFRKLSPVEPVPTVFLEMLVMFLPCLAYLLWVDAEGTGHFLRGDTYTSMLLFLCGFVSALPMIGHSYGAKRINLITLGLTQYASPTVAFLLGVFLYSEPLAPSRLITFAFVWVALALYTGESIAVYNRSIIKG